ncbi:MAG TPA: hypothetical protein PKD53_04740 [Chloroflexaceae bacterium]|nr:hypothetical protein [Chloroflexaceae bacterium]
MSRTPRPAPQPAPAPEPASPPALTPASAFRRAGIYELPHSGHVVELRWPGLYALALTGEIPNPLAQDVLRLVSGAAAGEAGEQPSEEEQVARYRKDARSFLAVAARCLVHPRLVLDREPDADRDEIGPDDLHELDVLWIYGQFVQRGPTSEYVAPFRRG